MNVIAHSVHAEMPVSHQREVAPELSGTPFAVTPIALHSVAHTSSCSFEILAAQCEIPPPHIAQYPCRDSIAEGGIAGVLPCFHRVSRKYR